MTSGINKCIGDDTKSVARQSQNFIKKPKKIKYREKRFSIWWMDLLHPAMWNVALESWQWTHQVAAHCNVIRGSGMACRWIRPVATPYNVTHSSGIMTSNSPAPCNVAGGSGMTCHGIRPNVRHIGILHLISILTSTCHSAPWNFIQIGQPSAGKKWRHVDFQDGRSQPSWILRVQYWVLWKANVRLPIGRQ